MRGLPSVRRCLRPCSPANSAGHLPRQAGAVVLARFRFLGPRLAGNPHSNKLSRRLSSIPACLQSPCPAVLAAAERRRAPCWELPATTAAAHRRSPVRGSQEKFQAYITERGFSQSAADFLIRSILTQVRVPPCTGASAYLRAPTRPRPSSARHCANRTRAYCVRGAVVPRLHELSVRSGRVARPHSRDQKHAVTEQARATSLRARTTPASRAAVILREGQVKWRFRPRGFMQQ